MDRLDALLRLVERMREPLTFEGLMQLIADSTADIIGSRRASVRLLDPGRSQLIAVSRAGVPMHDAPAEFRRGEGLIGWIVEHGKLLRLADAESDPRFAPRPNMTERMGAFMGAPIRAAGIEPTGVVSVANPTPFDDVHERLLALIAASCGPYLEIARLARLSRVDPLTGALNRRGLDSAFPEVVTDPDGLVVPLSVILVDIDHFKRVNDELGHAVGDLVLRHVATILAGVLRGGDAVIRYGGEEFLLILPTADRTQAVRIAERARLAIAAGAVLVGDRRVMVTASLGVAERTPKETRDALLARADTALYRAKHGGRDRVELAD
jgi:diguanylate cyclase (GGDEF)-like protein